MNSYYNNEPLKIGKGIKLLVDDTLIEDRFGVKRIVEKPLKYCKNPVIAPDKPWENGMIFAPQVIYDEDEKIYKMWYQSWSKAGYFSGYSSLGIDKSYYVLYAQSKDGFNWEKPTFPIYPLIGHEETNIVWMGRFEGGGTVFCDKHDKDKTKKYKLIYKDMGALCLAYSADGIHWREEETNPVIDYRSDTTNHFIYDEQHDEYILIMRPRIYASGRHEKAGVEVIRHHRRRVAITRSKDCINWSKIRTVLYPDEVSLPDYDSMNVINYHGKYIGMTSVFDGDNAESGQRFHVELAFSDDCHTWSRLPDRQIFLGSGPAGSFDEGYVSCQGNLIYNIDNQMTMFYTGSYWNDNQMHSQNSIGMAMLNLDRFVGQYGSVQGGYLLTKEFIWEGQELKINCRPKFGQKSYIQVEIIDYYNKPYDGFGIDDCIPITSDNERVTVAWKNGSDLSDLIGKPVMIRFLLVNAGVYSFIVG